MISTIYASDDGTVYGNSATYSTARTTGATADTTYITVGQDTGGSGYRCYEGFATFLNTTVTGDKLFDITDVDLYLKVATGGDKDTTAFDLKVVKRDYGGGSPVVGDYVSGASISGTVLFQEASGTFAGGAYDEVSAAIAWPGKGGMVAGVSSYYFQFLLYSSRHAAGTTPTGDEVLYFCASSTAGTTSDPYVVIDWCSTDPVAGNLHGALGPVVAWNRALSASEVRDVMNLGMVVNERVLDNGTATIRGTVDTAAGTKVPAKHVRSGWWLQNLDYQPDESDMPRPLLISGASVNVESDEASLTIGTDWMQKEIGVRMADLLAQPEPQPLTAEEASAADPYAPESAPESEEVPEPPAETGRETYYWTGYESEEAYLAVHPWMP